MVAIESETKNSLPSGFCLYDKLIKDGCTWCKSTIILAQVLSKSNAEPTTPGSRAEI